jgi:methionyl-tRNA formyltransferase
MPEYRGSGALGLWEIRDGKTEMTLSAHRVTPEADGGGILGERSIPIEPFDTLTSLALEVNIVGIDGLIDPSARSIMGS